MQISSDLKSLELLGISGKGRLQFCEDLDPCKLNSQFSRNSKEFLGILKNSQLCKWPLQTEFPVFWEFLGILKNSQLCKLTLI